MHGGKLLDRVKTNWRCNRNVIKPSFHNLKAATDFGFQKFLIVVTSDVLVQPAFVNTSVGIVSPKKNG